MFYTYNENDCRCYINVTVTADEVLRLAPTGTLPGFQGIKLGDVYNRQIAEQILGMRINVKTERGQITYSYSDGAIVTDAVGRIIQLIAFYFPRIYKDFKQDNFYTLFGSKIIEFPNARVKLNVMDYSPRTAVLLERLTQ